MKIKDVIKISVVLLLALLCLVGCNGMGKGEQTEEETVVYYTVTLNTNGGEELAAMQVQGGLVMSEPPEPKKEGFLFGGWQHEGRQWDFSYETVKGDMTLDAKWIDPATVFVYQTVKGSEDAVVLTELKDTELTKLEIPKTIGGMTVVAIGEGMFEKFTSETVTSITVPETVTTVGNRAFAELGDIALQIDGALTTVGEGAFLGCTGLERITFGEGLAEIPAEAFVGCTALKEIVLPKSVTAIRENAFEGCAAVVNVLLYGGVRTIEDSAFDDCTGLKTVLYGGSEEQLDDLLDGTHVAGMNETFEEAAFLLYSEQKPTAQTSYDGYWHWNEKGKVAKW